MFNYHNRESINHPQLLKLAEYIKQVGGKREGDDVLKRTNDRMKIATEKLDVYEKVFDNLSKEVENLQKDSSSYVSELEKLFSTIEEKKESLESLYIDWVKENDQDLKFLIFERKLYTVELRPLMNNMLYIKDIQEIIQGDLTDLKSYVEKLKKECSENQISSSLTNTLIEPQSNIM
ncbi:MAG: hypothetical protein KTV77_00945 [Wolbachia endosymbiont of Fragariocoptes setiger]|nr:hypothetical protein [Wolbachia endosymbiont of Fragariocoptes setiger]